MAQTLELSETEMVDRQDHKIKRYQNLNTVIMVEYFLKQRRDLPMKKSEIKKQLPKQIMNETLNVILEYLWKSGKIIYGPKGIQWIYSEPEHLKKMMGNAVEV